MAEFDPAPNEAITLEIGAKQMNFFAVPNPKANFLALAIEGRKAVVFQLHLQSGNGYFALKVMRAAHRLQDLESICRGLTELKQLPGMRVCERYCLTPHNAPVTLARCPDLEYAILMPWVKGNTWSGILAAGRNGGLAPFNRYSATRLATNFAVTIARLEEMGIAHCDLAGQNIIIEPHSEFIQLIDVEDMFRPKAPPPAHIPAGTAGYQHRTSGRGQWSPEADRFAAAILICEMLTWHDPAVRAISFEESYFEPRELQSGHSSRLDAMLRALAQLDPRLSALLNSAWNSQSLSECPRVADWKEVLTGLDNGIKGGNWDLKNEASVTFVPWSTDMTKPVISWSDWGEALAEKEHH